MHKLKIINLENPLMVIAQIYYLTRPMCFYLSRVARVLCDFHFREVDELIITPPMGYDYFKVYVAHSK